MKQLSKCFVVVLMMLCVNSNAFAGTHTEVVVPESIDKISNDTIRNEIQCILTNDLDNCLFEYKTRRFKNALNSKYKGSHSFNVGFSDRTRKKKKESTSLYYSMPNNIAVPTYIAYYHVSYMLLFQEQELSYIKENYLNQMLDQKLVYQVKVYISKDRLRSYLSLNVRGNKESYKFVFVIDNSILYKCIVFEENSIY